MFIFEKRNSKILSESTSAKNDLVTFHSLFTESSIDFSKTMSKYSSVIETSLFESNYVYNEHIRSNLKQYSLDCLANATTMLETSIDILVTLKNVIIEEITYLKNTNKKIIEIYEPLLKKLDRHKYGYQIPEYTLENLDPDDIFDRVLDLLTKKFNLNLFGSNSTSPDNVQNSIYKYNKNIEDYHEQIKRTTLGVPNSYNILNFHDTVRSFLVKENNLQMKRIGDDLFSDLRSAFINIESIDRVIRHIEKEIFDIYSHKAVIENYDGNEYLNSVITNAIVIRTNLIGQCLTYIEDIIKIKISIFGEMCINYRKVMIHGYERISTDPESDEGIYVPSNDSEIAAKHSQYMYGHRIIIPK